jgi:hypothetical protein
VVLLGRTISHNKYDDHIPQRCCPPKRCTILHLNHCPSPVITPNRDLRLRHGPTHAHKIYRDSGLRERGGPAYLHAASRQVISQEIAELEAADLEAAEGPDQGGPRTMGWWWGFGRLKAMAKNEFRLQRGTGDQGGKTQYRHTVSIHAYHKSICIGNGMTVASTHLAARLCAVQANC